MAGAGVAVKFAGTDPYCRGYGPAPHVEVLIARTAPYTGAARAPHLKPPPRTAQAPYTGGCPSGAWVARRWASGRPRGGRQRSARALSASSSGEGPGVAPGLSRRGARPPPPRTPGEQQHHQTRPGRKHIPEDARGAYLPPWSTALPRPRPLLPDLTERITVFSIDNSATRRCDGTYGSHVGGPLDCGQGWARRPLYDAPTRIKDLRAVQRAHQRPDRSNR